MPARLLSCSSSTMSPTGAVAIDAARSPAATRAADGGASASSGASASPLEQRLQRTNRRIGQLLDQMSWKEEEEEQNDARATIPGAAVDGERGAAAAAAAGAAIEASAASAAPAAAAPSAAPLLSSCRPLDRAAFQSRVSTFTRLVWLHRAETGTALSPGTKAAGCKAS